MPSPLEWLSFTFASGNLLAGPYFELSDYLNFMEGKGPWDPKSKRPTAKSQYGNGVSFIDLPWQISAQHSFHCLQAGTCHLFMCRVRSATCKYNIWQVAVITQTCFTQIAAGEKWDCYGGALLDAVPFTHSA